MFCKYCGKDLGNVDIDVCENCKKSYESDSSKTATKENETVIEAEIVSNENSENNENYSENDEDIYSNTTKIKSKRIAGLLGIFLGAFGVHNFYLGYDGKAIAQLLITILSCGVFTFASALWGFIEGILILIGEITVDGKGNPLKNDT